MAILMRRLLVEAQAKLRRMVEEHSTNLTPRIDPDYPSCVLTPVSPACQQSEAKEPDRADVQLQFATNHIDPHLPLPQLSSTNEEGASCDVVIKSDQQQESFRTPKPNSIDSKRSKSLGNTSSLDSSEENKSKNDVKKTVSNPVKLVSNSFGLEAKVSENKNSADVPAEESTSPSRGRSTPEIRNSDMCESPKPGCSTQQDIDSSSPRSSKSADGGQEENCATLPSPSGLPKPSTALRRLRLENEKLQAELTRLRRLVVSGAASVLAEKKGPTEGGAEGSSKAQVLEMELQLAKEALATLKADRRRLKAEKFDLLNQMKQLYATLEDKENELRDFIRNYEQVRENETSLRQLSTEREERERERWSLLRHARDEAERSLSLAAQLNAKELQLQQAQEQLQEARRQIASGGCLSDQESLASLPRHSLNGGALTPSSGGLLSGHHGLGLIPGDRGSCSADSGVRVSSDRESGATSVAGNLSDSTTDVSSIPPPHMYQSVSASKDYSPTLSPLNANNFSRSIDGGVLSRSVEQLNSPLESEPIILGRRPKNPHSRPGSGRGGTWGSISRVFARSRHRNKSSTLQENGESNFDSYRSWSPLTEEGYSEKLRLLREASTIPMERWKAPTVLAWLEVALGMPQYGARCAENVKSGKVLLELSDLELECGLGITHPMHRKKLRLAIEEHRHPALVRYPCIAQLGHTWVSSEWLPDLGLSQYSESFTSNMVDARMLEHLSKKELEKFLGVTRKFHQASIVHGIHLLRIMKYDRQALAVRRHQCENVDADPLVWTNQRFIRWARNIDLGEYADNLKDSGVHGGLVVLEPSFNGDTMATALGIPASKNIIRRHLTAELEALVLPARSMLKHYVRVRAKSRVSGGSLGRSFSRSCAGLTGQYLERDRWNPSSRRTSLRGSLNRAFGLAKVTPEVDVEKLSSTSSSASSSVVSRASPPLMPFKSVRSGDESPIYMVPHNFESNLSNRKSDTGEYDLTKAPREVIKAEVMEGTPKSEKSNFFYNIIEGSLKKSRRQHRRVRSISEINFPNMRPV